MSKSEPSLEDTLTRPVYLEKFDAWATYQKRCPFKAGPGGLYCKFEGHSCAFKLCPMRMFEEEITISQMVSKDLQDIQGQIAQINKKMNQMSSKLEKLLPVTA